MTYRHLGYDVDGNGVDAEAVANTQVAEELMKGDIELGAENRRVVGAPTL